MDPDVSTEDRSVVIRAVQALLDRQGVPERKRNLTLEAILGVEYNQIVRRMSGKTPWGVQELARLAVYFDEPVYSFVGAMVDGAGEPAVLHVSGLTLPCAIWVGSESVPSRRRGPFLESRLEGAAQWNVQPMAEVGDSRAYEIKRLIFEALPPRRVAVVDDDEDLTAAIVEFLQHKGLDAVPYRDEEHVRTALKTSSFDAFILDWVLDHGNVKDLMAAIRAKHPTSPIIILTGQLNGDAAKESELASAIAFHRAQLYEKPARLLSLFSALESSLNSSRTGS
jgi:ActR/RegA family two-component response regulator